MCEYRIIIYLFLKFGVSFTFGRENVTQKKKEKNRKWGREIHKENVCCVSAHVRRTDFKINYLQTDVITECRLPQGFSGRRRGSVWSQRIGTSARKALQYKCRYINKIKTCTKKKKTSIFRWLLLSNLFPTKVFPHLKSPNEFLMRYVFACLNMWCILTRNMDKKIGNTLTKSNQTLVECTFIYVEYRTFKNRFYKTIILSTILSSAYFEVYHRHRIIIARFNQRCVRRVLKLHWNDFITNIFSQILRRFTM